MNCKKRGYPTILTLLFFIMLSLPQVSCAQAPAIQWQKNYGGSNSDDPSSIQFAQGGGYIELGRSYSTDHDVSGNHGNGDFWVVQFDTGGVLQWQKTYGGSQEELGTSIYPTTNGDYIMAGVTHSNDGDVSGYHVGKIPYSDYWVVKIASDGTLKWQKCLGGTGEDDAQCVRPVAGGYIVAGQTSSTDGDVTGLHLDSLGMPTQDMWIVKLDNSGNILWQKAIGGSSFDVAQWVEPTLDGGYIVAGSTDSKDGDAAGDNYHDSTDVWVVKLDADGNIMWQKAYGGKRMDEANCIRQTRDSGYIFAGFTNSDDGDVSGNHGPADMWVVKLNATGKLIWQKCLGGSSSEGANSIMQTADGGYIVAGLTNSSDGQVSGLHKATMGLTDYWVVRLDDTGGIKWQRCLGGSSEDDAADILQTADSGYIVTGTSYSDDGDITHSYGNYDYWTVKLAKDSVATGIAVNNPAEAIKVYPTLTTGLVYIDVPDGLQAQVSVFDITGLQAAVPQGSNYGRISVQLAGKPAGMYILQVTCNGITRYYRVTNVP